MAVNIILIGPGSSVGLTTSVVRSLIIEGFFLYNSSKGVMKEEAAELLGSQ